jgi:hypothetical protein
MSVTATAGSEKGSDVAAASLLKVVDERLSTDAVTLTQKNVATEGGRPEDEEEDLKNESMSTNQDDESQKDEINNEEIQSKKTSGDSLEKASNALTGMSVTATAGSEKYLM